MQPISPTSAADPNTQEMSPGDFPPPVGNQPAPPREIGLFASFALTMSMICILAGGITSFPSGFCSVGGASIGIGWPLFCVFSLVVALTMGQVVSAFPRAGGPCEWAAELGGAGWGWVAGWFNLLALITALAAVNVGLCEFAISGLARFLEYDPEKLSPWITRALVVAVTISQAFINYRGIRLTTLLTNFSGYLIMFTAVGFTVLLLICAAMSKSGMDLARLTAFLNFSGVAGGNVWPPITSILWLFALGLILPAYTMTGFDAAAQMAEETRDPEVNVPKAIWQAVVISGLAGWVMLSAVVLAAPNMQEAAASGKDSFFFIIRSATPGWTHAVIYLFIELAQYLCGLAFVTSASRLTWALARDNGMPFARQLRRIGTHKTPSVAIWTMAAVTVAISLSGFYGVIAAACAAFFYIAYVIPTACGLWMYGRWPRMGPWTLGRWYPPLAVVCVLGCLGLLVLAVQPPYEDQLWILPATGIGLAALWFGHFRLYFRDEVNRALRKLAAFRDCHDVMVTPLGGGLTNRNYRVEIDGESYVLRIAGAGADKLLIDRAREATAVRSASAAGVAPDVVDHLPDFSVLVTRFVRGKQLSTEDVRQGDVLRRVAQAMLTYHNHPVSDGLGVFSPFDVVRYYYSQAREKKVPLPDDLVRAQEMLKRIEDAVTADAPHCLCHNDLLLGNFIDSGTSLLIIDWEYAGLGNRYFDLGNFAAHNQLTEVEERALLEHYFGEARPEDLHRLQLMRLVSDLRESTWGYLQSAISTLHNSQHYLDYGRRFLDRFFSALGATNLAALDSETPK